MVTCHRKCFLVTDPLHTTGRPMVRVHQVALTLDRLMEHIPVRSKSHRPDPYHGVPDIWQGVICRRSAGRKKYGVPSFTCDKAAYASCVDAKHRPEGLGSDVTGVGKATSGSLTDKLTREHRLTLDEAHLILNAKKEDPMEQILAVSVESSVTFFASADGWWSYSSATSTCSNRIRFRKQQLLRSQ